MRRRILVVLLSLTVLSVAVFFVPAVVALRAVALQTQEVDLQVEAFEALRQYERVGRITTNDHHSLAVYDAAGTLLSGEGPAEPDQATARALGGRAAILDRSGVVVVALPLEGGGVLRAAEPDSRSSDRASRAVLELTLIALAVIAAAVAAAVVLSRRLNRPLAALADSAGVLGGGDFQSRVPTSGLAELDQVADALNASARRVGDLLERERQLTADMAHQLRTPLAGIRIAVETELEHPRADRNEVLREVLAALDRVEYASANLITLHRDHADHQHAEIDACIDAAVDRWADDARRMGRTVEVGHTWPEAAAVRPGALDAALDVLIENALVHGAGVVSVWMRAADDTIIVKVADEGEFPGDHDPFAAGRPAGGAHGIGLPLVRSLLSSEHAGVRLAIRRPTTFAVDLPLAD
jgi:signal transduction histidine kinase